MPTRSLPQLPDAAWTALQHAISTCNRCPRLRAHCISTGQLKRAAYRSHDYWAKPVPNLGSPSARLLILGLAPAAHGANRTGRMFTGDRSGDFLFQAMHTEGFANQPTSLHRDDGLQLIDCAITATAHCAPPANKPTPQEVETCRDFLDQTIAAMPALASGQGGILVLGKIGFDAALNYYKRRHWLPLNTPRPTFAHGALYTFPPPASQSKIKNQTPKIPASPPFLLCTYHPSQQNTFTGRLTQPMLRAVFAKARQQLDVLATPPPLKSAGRKSS
jgi:uracil-DNA glycosylase family 4